MRSCIGFCAQHISVAYRDDFRFLPPFALLALLPIPIVLRTIWGIWQSLDEEEAIIPFLGQNVVVTLLTPLLLAIGLFIA